MNIDLISILLWVLGSTTVICLPLMLGMYLSCAGMFIPMIKAKLGKAPVIMVQRADGRMMLVSGQYKCNTVETKEFGHFITTPESLFNFYGVRLGIAYERIGHTLSKKFLKSTQFLKDKGIESYKDVEESYPELLKIKTDLTQKDLEDKENKDKYALVTSLLSNVAYIKNYFKFKLSPAQIGETISNEIRIKERKNRTQALVWFAGISFAIFVVAIAAYIIMGQLKCPDCSALVNSVAAACKSTGGSSVPM